MASLLSVNQIGSGMVRIDETYNETKERTKKRLELYEAAQHIRTSFQIGSVTQLKTPLQQPERALLAIEGKDNALTVVPQNGAKHVENHVNGLPEPYLIPEHIRNSREAFITKNAAGKMKLAELYQFKGVSDVELNALPNDVTTLHMLQLAIDAQARQHHQAYRLEFDRLFLSPMSQAIFQDFYWWIFLNCWQPNADYQCKLMSRVAQNFMSLKTLADNSVYCERFLKDYPMLISQAVYAAFCESFIDSYPQFDERFKEAVIRNIHEWLTGVKPAARLWVNWNFAKLEPEEITSRKKILQASEKQKSITDSWISESDATMVPGSSERRTSRHVKIMPHSTVVSKGDDNHTADDTSQRGGKESHPVGKGPTYTYTAFNLNGLSPVVAHVLDTNNARSKAGLDILIKRVEIENLPPLNAPTYRDTMRMSFQKIRQADETYRQFHERTTRESLKFSRKLRREQRIYKQQDEALLKEPREVRRLSDLITCEHKRSKSSAALRTVLHTGSAAT